MPIRTRHVITVSLLLVEALGLIWWFPYLPMTDLPEHMLAAQVLTHYDAPEMEYPLFISKRFPWNPYSSYFLFTLALGPFLSVANATRLYLTIGMVLTIASVWCWIQTQAPGRDAQVIPATLLLYGYFFYLGLINFLFSIPFFFFSIVLSWRLLHRDNKRWSTTGLLSLCLLLTYLSHIVTYALCGLMVIAQCLFFRPRRLHLMILPFVPSILLLLVYSITDGRHAVTTMTMSWDPLLERAGTLLLPFNIFHDLFAGRWVYDSAALIVWVFVAIIMAGGSLYRRYSAQKTQPAFPVWVTLAVVLASTFLLPSNISGGLGVALRAAYFTAFALITLLPADWDRHSGLRLLMILTCAAWPAVLATRLMAFTSDMRDLERAISHIPPRQVIQPIITDPHSQGLPTYPFQHAAAWYSYYKGGISPYLFASWADHFPVRVRRQVLPNAPGEWQMQNFDYEANEAGTDYFLVRTHDARILADLNEHVPLTVEVGNWRVFGPNKHP